MKIKISKDFSETPGARYRDSGKYSGEEFRDDLLIPKFEEAISNGEKLLIDFDGGYGYPITFLEEVFGGLKELYPEDLILNTLEFISNEEPDIIDKVIEFITSPDRVTKDPKEREKVLSLIIKKNESN